MLILLLTHTHTHFIHKPVCENSATTGWKQLPLVHLSPFFPTVYRFINVKLLVRFLPPTEGLLNVCCFAACHKQIKIFSFYGNVQIKVNIYAGKAHSDSGCQLTSYRNGLKKKKGFSCVHACVSSAVPGVTEHNKGDFLFWRLFRYHLHKTWKPLTTGVSSSQKTVKSVYVCIWGASWQTQKG